MLKLLVAAAVPAESSDGISLLQTQAHIHFHEDAVASLPDPKKQSPFTSGQVSIQNEDKLSCAGGQGKWVKTTAPVYHPTDLSKSISKITGMTPPQSGDRGDFPNGKVVGGPDAPVIDQGPVVNEMDCFGRARIDYFCNTYAEDLVTNLALANLHNGIGIWYNPKGNLVEPNRRESILPAQSDCFCGLVPQERGNPGNIDVYPADADGWWFCRLDAADFEGVTQDTPTDLSDLQKEPKEKKTKEQKEACKASKSDAKEKKAAFKDLRKQVNALKAQMKAAKEAYKSSKDESGEACA